MACAPFFFDPPGAGCRPGGAVRLPSASHSRPAQESSHRESPAGRLCNPSREGRKNAGEQFGPPGHPQLSVPALTSIGDSDNEVQLSSAWDRMPTTEIHRASSTSVIRAAGPLSAETKRGNRDAIWCSTRPVAGTIRVSVSLSLLSAKCGNHFLEHTNVGLS